MEKKKQTYAEFFKEKYGLGWVIAMALLFGFATVRTYYFTDYPSEARIPLIGAGIMAAVIFGLSYFQYKKGDDTPFR